LVVFLDCFIGDLYKNSLNAKVDFLAFRLFLFVSCVSICDYFGLDEVFEVDTGVAPYKNRCGRILRPHLFLSMLCEFDWKFSLVSS